MLSLTCHAAIWRWRRRTQVSEVRETVPRNDIPRFSSTITKPQWETNIIHFRLSFLYHCLTRFLFHLNTTTYNRVPSEFPRPFVMNVFAFIIVLIQTHSLINQVWTIRWKELVSLTISHLQKIIIYTPVQKFLIKRLLLFSKDALNWSFIMFLFQINVGVLNFLFIKESWEKSISVSTKC